MPRMVLMSGCSHEKVPEACSRPFTSLLQTMKKSRSLGLKYYSSGQKTGLFWLQALVATAENHDTPKEFRSILENEYVLDFAISTRFSYK